MTEISQRQLRLGVAIAVLLQFAVVALFYFDVIPDPYHQPGTFLFHQGGDQTDYFALAHSLLAGVPIASKFTLGYPLLLIPWMVLFQPSTSAALIPPLAIFSALVLFPLAQIILASLALHIAHHRTIALLCVVLWTVLPILLYIALALIKRASLGAIWAVHLPWLQMLSDPPAAFFTLASFWMMFYVLDANEERTRNIGAILLGIISGLLLLIRLNSILSLVAVWLILAQARRWIALSLALVLTFVLFSPQLVYNAVYFGSPLTVGYQALDRQPPHGLLSVDYPLEALIGKYAAPIAGIGLSVLVFIVVALGLLWQRNRIGALAAGIWSLGYLIFFSCYYYSWVGGLTRFLIPAYPALCLLAATVIVRLTSRENQFGLPQQPLDKRLPETQ